MMEIDLERIIKGALIEANRVLKELGARGVSEWSYKEPKSERVTLADTKISERLMNYFREQGIPVILYDEELGRIELGKNPEYTIVVDPIDGTDNYFRGKGILLPCSTIIAIAHSCKSDLRFKDFISAGLIDHPSGCIWYAERGKGLKFNEKPAYTSGVTQLDKSTSVLIDFGYSPSLDFMRMVTPVINSSLVRNIATAGSHMSLVAIGAMDAHIIPGNKPDELAACNLLITEGGGSVLSYDRTPIDNELFDFKRKYPIVAASTQVLCEDILKKMGL
jgi:myo-inositol-1(or 4)-monophosphatase